MPRMRAPEHDFIYVRCGCPSTRKMVETIDQNSLIRVRGPISVNGLDESSSATIGHRCLGNA